MRRWTSTFDFKVRTLSNVSLKYLLKLFQRKFDSCIDKTTGRKIRKKLCGPHSTRPRGRKRKCNTFSCDFEWASERWEQCTHTCGSQGLRIRQTYCVPRNLSQTADVQLWRKMVDPRKCPGDRPQRIQECNRFPCPGKWLSIGKKNYIMVEDIEAFLPCHV